MNNNSPVYFPDDKESGDKSREKSVPCFYADIEIDLPDGRSGIIHNVPSEADYACLFKDSSIDSIISNGIHLGSIVDKDGTQLLSDTEIEEIYHEKRPAIFWKIFTPPAYSGQSSLDEVPNNLIESPASPQLPVVSNKALPARFIAGLPSPGILPPEVAPENPYMVAAKDVDIPSIISRVVRNVSSWHLIRCFDCKHYYYDRTLNYYKPLTNQRLMFFIDADPEVKKIKFIAVNIHSTVAKLIKNDSALLISDELNIGLSASVWVFRNFIVNVFTGDVIANDGTYFTRHALNAYYDKAASCPRFEEFLWSIANGDAAIYKLLWQTIGYLLSMDNSAKKFFLFYGVRDCGKSVLGDIIRELIGKELTSSLSLHNFAERFNASEAVNKLLISCMDLPNADIGNKAIGLLKQITGRDSIYSEMKFQDATSKDPTARILLGSNFPLRLSASDEALKARLITIPFRHRIPPEHQDHTLKDKLLKEASGICLKAMGYYQDLVRQKYKFQKVDIDSHCAIIDTSSLMTDFVNQCLSFTSENKDSMTIDLLYDAYTNFCNKVGLNVPLDKSLFSREFNSRYGVAMEDCPNKIIPSGRAMKCKLKVAGKTPNGFRGIIFK